MHPTQLDYSSYSVSTLRDVVLVITTELNARAGMGSAPDPDFANESDSFLQDMCVHIRAECSGRATFDDEET
jgi:hypothetical protein